MRFRYLGDPLFLCCLAVYAGNRFCVKPWLPNAFSQNYLNDLLCIPFWIPIMLLFMRKVGWRNDDSPPHAHEILIPLFVWSIAFEIYLPFTDMFRGIAFSDHVDILFYALGAFFAALFWRSWYQEGPSRQILKHPGEG